MVFSQFRTTLATDAVIVNSGRRTHGPCVVLLLGLAGAFEAATLMASGSNSGQRSGGHGEPSCMDALAVAGFRPASRPAPHPRSWGELLDEFSGTEPPVSGPGPSWTTGHEVALDLPTVQPRDFSTARATGIPTLIVAPCALHGGVVADLAPAIVS